MIRILHLSDIHIEKEDTAETYRRQLEDDLETELRIDEIDYLTVSGDIANFSTDEEYLAAEKILIPLMERFGIEKDNIILVPGNHDLNWDLSEDAYEFVPKRRAPKDLSEDLCIPAGDTGVLVRNETAYQKRFNHFRGFYEKITGKTYPELYNQQGVVTSNSDDGIVFIGLSSSWEIDHSLQHQNRSSIHPNAVDHALDQMSEIDCDNFLKIAVCHHPVSGPEMMKNIDFLQRLSVCGVKVILHGHIHESQQGFYYYDPARQIHIVGAGTFGAPTRELVLGIPYQYNLLEYDPTQNGITVRTRKKERPEGAWSADARWGDKNAPVPYYVLSLDTSHKTVDQPSAKHSKPAENKTENATAIVNGDGAIAIGNGAASAGKGGVAVSGNVTGGIHVGDRITYQNDSKIDDFCSIENERNHYLDSLIADTNRMDWLQIAPEYADACQRSDQTVTLSDIYTALNTTEVDRNIDEEMIRRIEKKKEEAKQISALEIINRNDRVVLLGDPGSGKTTFVNYMTHILAKACRFGEDHLQPLTQNKEWNHNAVLPIRIIIREFAEHLSKNDPPKKGDTVKPETIIEYLQSLFMFWKWEAFWKDFLVKLSKDQMHFLFFFDGLDEAPSNLRKTIVEAIYAFADRYRKHRYVVTCRIHAYIEQPDRLRGFHQAVIAPFDDEQIENFVTAWYTTLFQKTPMLQRDIPTKSEKLRLAVQRGDIREMATRPLLLTVMAILHTYLGQLPEDRIELYTQIVELLLRRWKSDICDETGKGILERLDMPGLRSDHLDSGLFAAAFNAHAGASAENRDTADISEQDLLFWLKPTFNDDYEKARIFVNYIRERTGLLIRHKENAFRFPHRTFQEFLAARHLAGMDDYIGKAAELVIQSPVKWREVFIMAAGYAARNDRIGLAISAVNELCPSYPAENPDIVEFFLAEISALALMEIGRVTEYSRRKTKEEAEKRVRKWLERALVYDQALHPIQRVICGNVLAELGDTRPEVGVIKIDEKLTIPDIEWCYVPPGAFWMGGDKYIDEHPVHKVAHLNYGYWISRYPVTVAQYQAFVESSGHQPESENSLKGISNHPVRYVTWYEALKFCEWLTKIVVDCKDKLPFDFPEGYTVQLPSEAEWEKAARGGEEVPREPIMTTFKEGKWNPGNIKTEKNPNPKREYPWGKSGDTDIPDPNRVNYNDTKIGTTSAVGGFPGGETPYGCLEMSGNVWEWTRSIHKSYKYEPKDGRENLNANEKRYRVLRGGSYLFTDRYVRCAYRHRNLPLNRDGHYGFRVLFSPNSPSGL